MLVSMLAGGDHTELPVVGTVPTLVAEAKENGIPLGKGSTNSASPQTPVELQIPYLLRGQSS